MPDDYFFSERDGGVLPQVSEDLDEIAWGGIVALVNSQLASQSFALAFPVNCDDRGRGVIATDEDHFWLALRASVPDAPLPFSTRHVPAMPVAMDVLEFAGKHIAQAAESDFHDFYRHRHLDFNEAAGLAALRREANLIFRRSGLSLAVEADGSVSRLASPVVRERIERPLPATGRPSLDERLARAIEKYRSPNPVERREALEKLWDAWEEIKTLRGSKPAGIESLIGEVAGHPAYVSVLDEDARALTAIGNAFQIRHSEVDRFELESTTQVDYFFGRLFNVIWLFLTALTEGA